MKKKWLSLVLAGAMVLSVFAGCGSAASDTASSDEGSSDATAEAPAASAEGGSVYWLNFKPEADEALQQLAADYTAETGVQVTVETAADGGYQEKLSAEMDNNIPTLFVVGNTEAVKTWADFCYDLEGTDVYNELNSDAYTLRDSEGKVCSIGYCYECYGIIVNKTLLEEAGHSIDEITDFASLKAVADDIHANAATLGFDAFTSSGMDDSSSWRFSGHLANLPLYYEEQDDGGWTECPSEIKGTYLNLYKNIWDLYITDTATDKSALADGAGLNAETEFKNREAVFYQNGSWEYDALTSEDAENPDFVPFTDDELQMIPIYCGADGETNAGLCAGTENCWAVNANASEEDIQATLDFMYWMVTSEEGTSVMCEQFGVIPYNSCPDPTNKFLNDANTLASEGKYTLDWAFNYTPNVDTWRAGVVSAINQYDAGEDWSVVENAFVQGWATQYQAANE